MKAKDKRQSSFKRKIMLTTFLAFFVMLFAALSIFRYAFEYDSNSRFQNRLISIVSSAALSVNPSDFNKLVRPKDEYTREYRQIRYTLQNFMKANPDVLYIYTLRKTSEKNIWQFVVDADKEPYHIGDRYEVTGQEAIQKATLAPVADTELSSGRKGKFYSGFAPIKDEAGNTVGVVGVDISAEKLLGQQKRILLSIYFGLFFFTMFIALKVYRKNVRSITEPLKEISAGIQQIKDGNYTLRININSNDEFHNIGEMINDLADFMLKNQKLVEADLKCATESREKMYKVYGDVISSMTNGKFNLISNQEVVSISLEGVLFTEVKLEKPEDVDKATLFVEKLFRERGFRGDGIKHGVVCVAEAATNAIKHAGAGVVQFRILDNRLRVILSDSGSGMDFNNLPNMLFLKKKSANETLTETGLTIIYKYATKIFLTTSEKGTVLVMDFDNAEENTSENLAAEA